MADEKDPISRESEDLGTPEGSVDGLQHETSVTNNNLTTTLVFGTTEKILTREEKEKLIGGIFRVELYGEKSYCKITGISSYNNEPQIESLEPERPHIRGDETEMAEVLREQGFGLIHEGRSGFDSRNHYLITKEGKKENKSAPLIVVGTEVVWTGTLHEGELLDEGDIQAAKEGIQSAKEECKERKAKKMYAYIQEHKNGDISVISVGGGPEEFSFGEIPEDYLVVNERRIANTQDHRRNMSHTYEVVLINKRLFEGKSYVKIQVPDEYKGIVIGKGGSKIKELSEKMSCTISVK